ncbi:unnamed protein product [Brachionus calyciflorus]|uniref:SWIM-type domain-containing protein n=1 Tax=Brachionus calyciflorus TaxID=104777 RepID=A0A814JEW0_9BILA|nr:unnamed protein product [Brachionus calyciflorus]
MDLFKKKWKHFGIKQINDFLTYFNNQWCKSNNGWLEKYSVGIQSTSNALESFHDKIKKDLKDKRFGIIEFLNECESNLIHRWSTRKSPTLTLIRDGESVITDNLNIKTFDNEPFISSNDYTEAYKWNRLNKSIIVYNDQLFMPDGKKKTLSKEDCKLYLEELQQKNWSSFDMMIEFLDSIHIVSLNKENWKLSICSCSFWLKNLHCSHVISCAYRSKLCSFDSIGMNLPIERNKKRGPQSETANAYNKQPGENDKDDELILPVTKKSKVKSSQERQDQQVCPKCNTPMLKRRYWYCENKC